MYIYIYSIVLIIDDIIWYLIIQSPKILNTPIESLQNEHRGFFRGKVIILYFSHFEQKSGIQVSEVSEVSQVSHTYVRYRE